jgi:glutamate:GABA antiporter
MTLRAKTLTTEASNRYSASEKKSGLLSEEYIPKVMPRILSTWDMTTTFVVSTYLATCATTAVAGGPAALTYLLLVALIFFVPCLIATMQLGIMFPHEGALYNWTHKALGGYWSFFSGFCAWFPGVLISSSLADLLVTYIQSMHSGWLTASWQQGLTICGVLLLCGVACTQPFRSLQNIVNVLVCLMFVGSFILGISGVIWLMTGHPSATNFARFADWTIRPGNFAIFGLVAFAYIGTEGPLYLAGEMRDRHVIKPHLLCGALLIFSTYISNTFAVLVVQGQKAAYDPFSLVSTVDIVLGKRMGDVVAVCFIGSFIATVLLYNYLYSRLLLVASVDRHLPLAMGKLNEHRVPANAIVFQTVLAITVTVLIFVIAPTSTTQADLSVQVYNVSQAAAALIWAISAAFMFIDLFGCYMRDRVRFLRLRMFPLPVIWCSSIVGLLSCILIVVDTLLFSWTSSISSSQWWYLVGSLTLIFLLIAAVGSLVARGEADWQNFRR